MSSQQQSPSYKRRSSGKRTRRAAQDVTSSTAVQDAAQVTETVATSVGDEPVAKASSKNGSTSTSTAASRAASKASAKPEEGSKWQQLINTDRFEGLRKFIRETWAEIKKVIWPDRETTRNLTLVVIAVSVVLGILLGGIDYVLFQLFEALP